MRIHSWDLVIREYLIIKFVISNNHIRTDELGKMRAFCVCVFMLKKLQKRISNTEIETSKILAYILLKKGWIEVKKLKI